MTKKTVISKTISPKKTAPMKKSMKKTSGRMSAGAKARNKAEPRKSAKVRLPKGPIWQWSALERMATSIRRDFLDRSHRGSYRAYARC